MFSLGRTEGWRHKGGRRVTSREVVNFRHGMQIDELASVRARAQALEPHGGEL